MPPPLDPEHAQRRRAFVQALAHQLQHFRQAALRLDRPGVDAEAAAELAGGALDLAAAAAHADMPALSAAARELAQLAGSALASPTEPADWHRLWAQLDRLDRLGEQCLVSPALQLGPPPPLHPQQRLLSPPLVCVVGPLASRDEALRDWLHEHDCELGSFGDLDALNLACQQGRVPSVVIVDGAACHANLRKLGEARLQCQRVFPVIWIGDWSGLTARLSAHRAGVNHVLPRRFEHAHLFRLLAELTQGSRDVRPRVLLLSDAPAPLLPLRSALDAEGMDLVEETDAAQLLQLLRDAMPDVLLIDARLQAHDAHELAAMLCADVSIRDTLSLALLADAGEPAPLLPPGVEILSPASGIACLAGQVRVLAQRARRQSLLWQHLLNTTYEREREHLALNQHAIVSIANARGRITYVNDLFCHTSGYSRGELLGRNHNILKSGRHDTAFYREMWNTIAGGHVWQGEVCNRRKDGRFYWVASTITPLLGADGKPYQYISIRTEITSVKQAEAALQEQNAQRQLVEAKLATALDTAEQASRAKSEFLAHMSHELRTPMNAILGFGQLLELDAELGERQRRFVRELLKGGRHLLALINDVLDLARVEAGRLDLTLEAVELAPLAAECLTLAQPLAAPRRISLHPQELQRVSVRADRLRLRQVLMNLLSNAIKYNRDGGRVELHAAPSAAGQLRLTVRDTGIGIPPERIGELFQPFNRLGMDAGTVEGTGIGLVITRRLIELMGGRVGVSSQPGTGSEFWFELPIDARAAAPLLPVPAPVPAIPAAPALAAAGSAARTLLYIEDNPANLELVAQIVGREPGLRLITAHAPRLGLDLALAHRPELILLDIQMPGMDGYQVLEQLRRTQGFARVPTVALTANAMPCERQRGLDAGFDAYLTKPLDITHFLTVVRHLLNRPPPG